jgi:CBS domain-containing protein
MSTEMETKLEDTSKMTPPETKSMDIEEPIEEPRQKRSREEAKGTTELEQQRNDFLQFLIGTRVEDNVPRDTTGRVRLFKKGAVACLSINEKLPRAFRKLAVENFLSAPVVDGRQRYAGMIDLFDMVQFTTDLFANESQEEWFEFWEKRQEFQQATVGQVMQSRWFSQTDPFHAVHQGFSLFHVFETMAKLGVHRVPILDDTEDIVGICTQSMAISIIRQQKHRMGNLIHCKLSEMLPLLAKGDVVTVHENEQALKAFRKMVQHNVSGLALVDNDGILTGTISIRDLRGVGMSGERFSRLLMPVKGYKELVLKEFPKMAPETHFKPDEVPKLPLTVTTEDTLDDVIQKMNDGNIHRVFLVSKESQDAGKPKPLRVIAQRDLILFLLHKMGICSVGVPL